MSMSIHSLVSDVSQFLIGWSAPLGHIKHSTSLWVHGKHCSLQTLVVSPTSWVVHCTHELVPAAHLGPGQYWALRSVCFLWLLRPNFLWIHPTPYMPLTLWHYCQEWVSNSPRKEYQASGWSPMFNHHYKHSIFLWCLLTHQGNWWIYLQCSPTCFSQKMQTDGWNWFLLFTLHVVSYQNWRVKLHKLLLKRQYRNVRIQYFLSRGSNETGQWQS